MLFLDRTARLAWTSIQRQHYIIWVLSTIWWYNSEIKWEYRYLFFSFWSFPVLIPDWRRGLRLRRGYHWEERERGVEMKRRVERGDQFFSPLIGKERFGWWRLTQLGEKRATDKANRIPSPPVLFITKLLRRSTQRKPTGESAQISLFFLGLKSSKMFSVFSWRSKKFLENKISAKSWGITITQS